MGGGCRPSADGLDGRMTARWRIAVLAVLVVAVAVGTTFVLTRPSAEQSQAVAAPEFRSW